MPSPDGSCSPRLSAPSPSASARRTTPPAVPPRGLEPSATPASTGSRATTPTTPPDRSAAPPPWHRRPRSSGEARVAHTDAGDGGRPADSGTRIRRNSGRGPPSSDEVRVAHTDTGDGDRPADTRAAAQAELRTRGAPAANTHASPTPTPATTAGPTAGGDDHRARIGPPHGVRSSNGAFTGQIMRDVRTPGATGPPARELVRPRFRSVVPVVRALMRPEGTAVRRLGPEGAGEACTIDRGALCRSALLRRPEARWPADGARGPRGTGGRRSRLAAEPEVQAAAHLATAQATIRTIEASPLTVDTRGRSRCAAPRRASRPRRPASRSNPPRVRRASSSSPPWSRFGCRSRRGGCDRSSSRCRPTPGRCRVIPRPARDVRSDGWENRRRGRQE